MHGVILSSQCKPLRKYMEYGMCRVLSYCRLLDLYAYTCVGRFSDSSNDKLLYQTMQGCAQSDVNLCRGLECRPMSRILTPPIPTREMK